MTFDEASKIVNIWGKYLEIISGKLLFIFGAKTPESLLPFPKDVLEHAINMVAEYHHNMGNQKMVKTLQMGIGLLTAYINDEEALLQAAKNFNDPKWLKTVLPALKESQKESSPL